MFLRCLLLILMVFSTSAFAQVVRETSFTVWQGSGLEPLQQTCSTAACSFATPVPYPFTTSFEVDSQGGRIRGRARMELGTATRGQLQGFVSYYTMAHATFIGASQPNLVVHADTMSLQGSVTHHNAVNGAVKANNLAGINTTIILGDQFNHLTRSSYAGGTEPDSVAEDINETPTVPAAFAQDFWVGVEITAGGLLKDSGASFDVDFRNTIEFVDLRFYDNLGNDVTQFYQVSFDDPEFYVRSLSPVPEPETYAMLLAGLGLLGLAARRRKLKGTASI